MRVSTTKTMGSFEWFLLIIIGPSALQGPGMNVVAQSAVLRAALSYAFAGIYGKRFKGIPPYVTAAGQVTFTTLLMVPIAQVII